MSDKRYTEEQFNRLPKWAQRELEGLERHVTNLKNSNYPDSNVRVSHHVYGDTNLPHDSQVDFYLGNGPYRKYQNMIDVSILRTKDRKALRISASGQIVVKPTGGYNVIEVTTEGH